MRSSGKLLVICAVTAAISLSVGFAGAYFIRSPADAAAKARPPSLTMLTANVEIGSVSKTIVLQGVIGSGTSATIEPAMPFNGDLPIVTGLPVGLGGQVSAGQVVAVVADRPVFVLPGSIPLLRPLQVGFVGMDVKRFQESLSSSGFSITDRPGLFGRSTLAAVRSMYARAGFSPPATGQAVVSSSEFTFVPGNFPATVTKVSVSVGDNASAGPILSLSTSAPVVTASANPVDAASIKAGMAASVSGAGVTVPVKATVASVEPATQSATGGFTSAIQLNAEGPLAAEVVGQSVEVTVDTASGGPSGLLVPLSAISSHANGSTYVTVVAGSGRGKDVKVQVIQIGDGRAQITSKGNAVSATDKVVVGVDSGR